MIRFFTAHPTAANILMFIILMLGLAALQSTALRLGQMADLQQRAVQLANEIGERMRANPPGMRRGEYNLPQGRQPGSPAGAALTDLQAWLGSLAGLPSGSGRIMPCNSSTAIPCPDIGGHIVTVYWNATRDPAVNGYRCPPRTTADHRCYRQIVR